MLLRESLLLCELCVEKLNASVLKKLGVVEGLKLAVHSMGGVKRLGSAVIGVDEIAGRVYESTGVSKKLKIDVQECEDLRKPKIEKLFHSNSPSELKIFDVWREKCWSYLCPGYTFSPRAILSRRSFLKAALCSGLALL